MKIERMRKGIVVLNKVDGKKYKVTDVSVQSGATVGTAYEMMEDELGEKCVFITEKNALAFRLLEDTEPYPVPEGFTVANGILLKNGIPACEQGSIVVDKILAVQEDCLILAANKGNNEYVDIMTYQVSRDRFNRLYLNVPEPKYIGSVNGNALFAYSDTYEKTEEWDDGTKVKILEFNKAKIYTIKDGCVKEQSDFYYPICVDDIKVVEHDGDRYSVFVPSDEYVDDEGNIIEREVRRWHVLDSKLGFCVNGDIQVSWSHIYKDWVVKTDSELFVLEYQFHVKSPEIAKLAGFDHLIDITKSNYQYTLTFSNDTYEFKTLCSKSTKDRGYIITVQ